MATGRRHVYGKGRYVYIGRDGAILGGEPVVKGTRTPVRAVVELRRMGYGPQETLQELPHLSIAEVLDALSYYSDHQEEINDYIERNRVPVSYTPSSA